MRQCHIFPHLSCFRSLFYFSMLNYRLSSEIATTPKYDWAALCTRHIDLEQIVQQSRTRSNNRTIKIEMCCDNFISLDLTSELKTKQILSNKKQQNSREITGNYFKRDVKITPIRQHTRAWGSPQIRKFLNPPPSHF